jgi:hypothetical protein
VPASKKLGMAGKQSANVLQFKAAAPVLVIQQQSEGHE